MKHIIPILTISIFSISCSKDKVAKQNEPLVAQQEYKAPILPEPVPAPVVPTEPELKAEPVLKPTPAPKDYAGIIALAKTSPHEEAIPLLEKAMELHPKRTKPRIELARAYLTAGDVKAARDSIESALEISESSSYAWNTLGRVELMAGDLEAAVDAFSTAVEKNEDNGYAWNNLGLVLMKQKRIEEAVVSFERATAGSQPKHYMWNNLGHAYEHLGKVKLAKAAYGQAADAGSVKAEANMERLKDVTLLVVAPLENQEEELEVVSQ